jgi:hypothetical protein
MGDRIDPNGRFVLDGILILVDDLLGEDILCAEADGGRCELISISLVVMMLTILLSFPTGVILGLSVCWISWLHCVFDSGAVGVWWCDGCVTGL